MNCICCNSRAIIPAPFSSKRFNLCQSCGLIFARKTDINELSNNIICHYQNIDPHEAVGISKKAFFKHVLKYLESKIRKKDKKILDVGCGCGYFLKMASRKGWVPFGVEITKDVALAARLEFGAQNIFHGVLNKANFRDNYFDAISMWDVLIMVSNPYEELKECHRILKAKGIIGIRVRNVAFQKLVYYMYMFFKKIYRKSRIKQPGVFHPFCFSPRAMEQLIRKSGFINIRIENSPLSSGDPYHYCIPLIRVQLVKTLIRLISIFVFMISKGRWIIGPSLLIWAEKP
jgi:ubiquinone/menaquinone biosynthesis C-methylase UbiE